MEASTPVYDRYTQIMTICTPMGFVGERGGPNEGKTSLFPVTQHHKAQEEEPPLAVKSIGSTQNRNSYSDSEPSML